MPSAFDPGAVGVSPRLHVAVLGLFVSPSPHRVMAGVGLDLAGRYTGQTSRHDEATLTSRHRGDISHQISSRY